MAASTGQRGVAQSHASTARGRIHTMGDRRMTAQKKRGRIVGQIPSSYVPHSAWSWGNAAMVTRENLIPEPSQTCQTDSTIGPPEIWLLISGIELVEGLGGSGSGE